MSVDFRCLNSEALKQMSPSIFILQYLKNYSGLKIAYFASQYLKHSLI